MVQLVWAALLPYTSANLLAILVDEVLPNLKPVVAPGEANYLPDSKLLNIYYRLELTILCMEVRWRIIIEKHSDQNPVKLADGWHLALIPKRPLHSRIAHELKISATQRFEPS